MRTAKTLIRLRGCVGWPEYSLCARLIVGFIVRWLNYFVMLRDLDSLGRFSAILGKGRHPVSILYKSTAGCYRPVRVADGLITTRCRFIKNATWSWIAFKTCLLLCCTQVPSEKGSTLTGKNLRISVKVDPFKREKKTFWQSCSLRKCIIPFLNANVKVSDGRATTLAARVYCFVCFQIGFNSVLLL